MMRTSGFVAVMAACAAGAFAQATLSPNRGPQIACPAANSRFPFLLGNSTNQTQTVPAGTSLTVTFSAPVTATENPGGPVWQSHAGNSATLSFPTSLQIAPNKTLQLAVYLDLAGLAAQTPISLSWVVTPASAVTFKGPGANYTLGLIDGASCQTPPANNVSVDDLISSCPTPQEVNALKQAVPISFESDPSAGVLVCQAAKGSVDLTRLQERSYQALRLMKAIPFDAPLPWTHGGLYDWLVANLKGIRYRADISEDFCCDPAGVINIPAAGLGVLQSNDASWLFELMVVFIHETRHAEIGPHTCGTNDQTLSDLGAWGVQYYAHEWMAGRSGEFLIAKTPQQTFGNNYYWNMNGAWSVRDLDLCNLEGGLAVSPRKIDFGAPAPNSPSSRRSVAVTLTEGLPQTIGAATITGADASDFEIVSNGCTGAAIPPSCAVELVYRPKAAGKRTAQLQIAVPGGHKTVDLTGNSASTCSFAMWPYSHVVVAGGGSGKFTVASAPGCNLSATSSAVWLTTSIATVNGRSAVTFTAKPNQSGLARQATVRVRETRTIPTRLLGGQTFTVTQGR